MDDYGTCRHCQERIHRTSVDGIPGLWWHVPASLPLYDCADGGTVAEPEEESDDDGRTDDEPV